MNISENKKVRNCPVCKAEVGDFESACEYCGTEIPLATEYASILQNAEYVLSKSEIIVGAKIIKETIQLISTNEEVLAPFLEQQKIQEFLKKLKTQKSILEEKLGPIQKKEHKKKTILTIILSIFSEIALFVVFALVAFFGKTTVENFIYGILGLLFIAIGIGLSENIWVGIIGGALAAALIGALFIWLVASAAGQIALIFIWTISVILFDVITLRKKD